MLTCICLWLTSLSIVFGLPNMTDQFPNPLKEYRKCGNPKESYVCDPDFILDRGDVEKLNQLAEEMKSSTKCLCSNCAENIGIKIGIFLSNNVTHDFITDENSKYLAENIRKTWNFGTCEDDILIILFPKLNISDFSLGSSVQNLLTEDILTHIFSDCQVHFDSGYNYQGLESIINSIQDVIIREQKDDSNHNNYLVFGIFIGIVILLALTSGLLALYFRQVKRRKQSCSNIYASGATSKDRRNLDGDQLEQLERLNKKFETENQDF